MSIEQPLVAGNKEAESYGAYSTPKRVLRHHAHHRPVDTVVELPLVRFCKLYFKEKNVDVSSDLPATLAQRPVSPGASQEQATNVAKVTAADLLTQEQRDAAASSPSIFSYRWYLAYILAFFKGFDFVFTNTIKLAPVDRRNHLIFYALLVLSFVAGVLSLFVSVAASSGQSCNLVIPDAANDCCQCVCDAKQQWCATLPNAYANVTGPNGTTVLVPLDEYGNYFSGQNSIETTASSRKLGVAAVYTMSLLFSLVELGVARIRGNWYMLLCVCTAMGLQGLRNVYLHFPLHDWNSGIQLLNVEDFCVLACDIISLGACGGAALLLKALRPSFLTTQFQQFGHLTTYQETLRNYNVMFATTLLDWQTSSLLYFQIGVLASNNYQILGCLVILYVCDVFSTYVGYQYIRFEKFSLTICALVAKMALALSWLALCTYILWCYDFFRARSLFLRSVLMSSQYLGVDAADGQAYLLGDCGVSPVVSGTGDVIVLFAIVGVAFFARVVAIFYAALLTVDFGKTVIASLFFDVVAIRQKEGLPPPKALSDTLDVHKSRH